MNSTNERQVPPSVGWVVGENLKKIRATRRLTQPQLAAYLARSGLPWKRTQIADLERDRRETIDLGTLAMLAAALDTPLARFFEGDGDVMLTPRAEYGEYGATASRDEIRKWLGNRVPELTVQGTSSVSAAMKHWAWKGREIPAEVDIALAEKLGVDPWRVIHAAEQLWGGSMTEERDRRTAELGELPTRERQAKQGHITRQLTTVVTKWLQADADAEGASDGRSD